VTFSSVLRCEDDAGRWQPDHSTVYVITELSAEPSPELFAALELGDEPPPVNPREVCPARAMPVLYLLLVDDTMTAYRPRIPRNWCGDPREEVSFAVDELGWTTRKVFLVKVSG
jgi:hypothetical protein